MFWIITLLLMVSSATAAQNALAPATDQTADSKARGVELICHRTANEDLPENTLESLEQAALLGCDAVEVDVRRTLDGKLVLNHDGYLERLTDGVGEVEESYYGDLQLRDAGSWMGSRFANMHIPLLSEALQLARGKNIRLILHVKEENSAADVLELVKHENMLERVQLMGEWQGPKQLDPRRDRDAEAWVEPSVTPEQIQRYHEQGKKVFVNFSANGQEMDLFAMKGIVAAGADGINVDFPRLGADAVGRPVERTLAALAEQANAGEGKDRARAILDLSKYRGYALQSEFANWLLDPDNHVSRAAALALATARPKTPPEAFAEALRSKNADARANGAWALGVLGAPANLLLPLLHDGDEQVVEETLVALAHMPGEVSATNLLPLLSSSVPRIRGAAALALAKHQPEVASAAVPAQLQSEIKNLRTLYDDWVRRGQGPLTPGEIDKIVLYYRCQMKEVLAISLLNGPAATQALEDQAFRPGKDFSQMNSVPAAFQLWDRIGADARPAVEALGSADALVADKAEWILIQGGPLALPDVRRLLASDNMAMRRRAIQIVAWQGDLEALPALNAMRQTNPGDAPRVEWAIAKIHSLHPTF